MQDPSDIKKTLTWLDTALRCPACGSGFAVEDTKVVEEFSLAGDSRSTLLHATCKQCACAMLYRVTVTGSRVFSYGVATDTVYSEVNRHRAKPPLSVDELIEWHDILDHFKGNFSDMFFPRKQEGS
jgi:transcription elongation factor Elf1